MARRTPDTRKNAREQDWDAAFLDALREMKMVSHAAAAAGVGRSTVYERRDRDPAFREAWDEIIESDTDLMEREAYRRAVLGVDKPVFQGGAQVGTVRERSDTLLIFLLKARRPETYRERHDVRHSGSVSHRHRLDLSKLTDEQLAALEAIQPDEHVDADHAQSD